MELNQTNYPRLWHIFQIVIGGTYDKRKLMRKHLTGVEKSILEVGCSVGNIAQIFKKLDVEYLGIDIDKSVIDYAISTNKSFPHLKFECMNLYDLNVDLKYDLIIFPAMFHHVPEHEMIEMLNFARNLMHAESRIIINDPIQPPKDAPKIFHLSLKYLEKGEFVRTEEDFLRIVSQLKGLKQCYRAKQEIAATPFSFPNFFYFIDFVLEKA